jgi:hypothetical protein
MRLHVGLFVIMCLMTWGMSCVPIRQNNAFIESMSGHSFGFQIGFNSETNSVEICQGGGARRCDSSIVSFDKNLWRTQVEEGFVSLVQDGTDELAPFKEQSFLAFLRLHYWMWESISEPPLKLLGSRDKGAGDGGLQSDLNVFRSALIASAVTESGIEGGGMYLESNFARVVDQLVDEWGPGGTVQSKLWGPSGNLCLVQT